MSKTVLETWIEVQRARLDHLKQDVREIPIGVISMPIRKALQAEQDTLPAMLLANGLTMERVGEQAGFPGTGKLVFRIIPARETQTVGPEDVGTLESVVGLEAKE